MARPNLQVALDHSDLPSAIKDVKNVGDIVDIIEVGTILLLQQEIRPLNVFVPCIQIRKLLRIQSVQTLVGQ